LAGSANDWEQFVFHGSGGGLPTGGGRAESFKVFFGTEFLDDTATDFVASGAIVTEFELSVEEDGDVTVSLTIEFARKDDPGLAPADADITVPSAEDVFPYHGGSVTAGGVQQTNLNSATITVSSLHRLRYGLDQIATGGVVGGIEVEVDTEAVYTEKDQLDLATTGTSGGSLVDEAPDVVIELSNANATSKTYTVNGARPDTHEWSSLVDPGDDLVESVTWVTGRTDALADRLADKWGTDSEDVDGGRVLHVAAVGIEDCPRFSGSPDPEERVDIVRGWHPSFVRWLASRVDDLSTPEVKGKNFGELLKARRSDDGPDSDGGDSS